jgi:hypothetical protein
VGGVVLDRGIFKAGFGGNVEGGMAKEYSGSILGPKESTRIIVTPPHIESVVLLRVMSTADSVGSADVVAKCSPPDNSVGPEERNCVGREFRCCDSTCRGVVGNAIELGDAWVWP